MVFMMKFNVLLLNFSEENLVQWYPSVWLFLSANALVQEQEQDVKDVDDEGLEPFWSSPSMRELR